MAANDPVAADEQNSTVAVYANHDVALEALTALKEAGFDADHVSIVGKGVSNDKEVAGWVHQGTEAAHWGSWGAFWGALTGWMVLGFLFLPGIGWVAAGGFLASTMVGAGLGAGLGALIGLGVDKDDIPVYENHLKADRYIVVVHGTTDSVNRAKDVLGHASGLAVPMGLQAYTNA